MLTKKEKKLLDLSSKLWNKYLKLEKDERYISLFRESINNCQRLIGMRVAKREDPEYWS